MKVSEKLALAYAWRHPVRMLLTSLATIASACVVVWVVSGYDALVGQFGSQATEYLGRYDLFLVPDSADDSSLSLGLVETMRKDTAIAEWEPSLQWTVRVKPDKPMDADAAGSSGGNSTARGGAQGGPPHSATRTVRNLSASTQPRLPIRWSRDAGSTRTTRRFARP